jgi:hypothetical protein
MHYYCFVILVGSHDQSAAVLFDATITHVLSVMPGT